MKKRVMLLIAIVIVIALVLFFIFYSRVCSNEACFKNALKKCQRASWIEESAEASWHYNIKWCFFCKECKVDVKLLQLKQGGTDIERIEGKSMECSVAKGFEGGIRDDIDSCHGILKEEMQNLVIKKMHSYLLANFNKIAGELNKTLA